MTDDPLLTAVLAAMQRFMDSLNRRTAKQDDHISAALAEFETRMAEIHTRAATSGPQGPQGERGEMGSAGAQGEPGQPGVAGPVGEKGERGADGLAGRDGAMGPQGERGADGLIGPAGAMGERGADGIAGRDGAPGPQGERGTDGLIGPAGPMGERGVDGLAGRDGVAGPQGERGERGADGIASLAELDARFAELERRHTEQLEARDADIRVRTWADYHQRTFVKGTHYKRGAIVAWGGATHMAMADTIEVPGTSPDWQMLAKPGRDGRDRK